MSSRQHLNFAILVRALSLLVLSDTRAYFAWKHVYVTLLDAVCEANTFALFIAC